MTWRTRAENSKAFALLLLATVWLHAVPLWASEVCYMAVFASDSCLFQKPSAHCFATFVRVRIDAKLPERQTHECFTLSWFPMTDKVRLIAPMEPGENRDLKRSLDRAACKKIRLCEWGPYQIHPDLYERALAQKALLESGQIGWQACDGGNRRLGRAINCVHAVSDIDCDAGKLVTGLRCGAHASRFIVEHLSRWIVQPCAVHEWVNELIGVAGYPYPIERRAFPTK